MNEKEENNIELVEGDESEDNVKKLLKGLKRNRVLKK